jgi:hypothetical protein
MGIEVEMERVLKRVSSAFVKITLCPFYASLISLNQSDFLIHHFTQSIQIHIQEVKSQKLHVIQSLKYILFRFLLN